MSLYIWYPHGELQFIKAINLSGIQLQSLFTCECITV